MNETEELELNQWCHEFLGECCHDWTWMAKSKRWSCQKCSQVDYVAFEYPPKSVWASYTTDLNLAAIVEAKVKEMGEGGTYLDRLVEMLAIPEKHRNSNVYISDLVSANAITRCRAARAAVEG